MASPAVRSLLGKSKLPLPLLIRGTALTSSQSKDNVGTGAVNGLILSCSEEVVPPPPPHQPYACIGKESLLGVGKAWASGRAQGVSGGEDGLGLRGRRPAVQDEEGEGEEAEEDEWDETDEEDDGLNDLGDSDDCDDLEEEEEDVPCRKSR